MNSRVLRAHYYDAVIRCRSFSTPTSKGQLRVEATSSNSTATLTVSVTSSGATIGTLANNGGGKYSGQFNVASNPVNITVRSSKGGSSSRATVAN